MGAPLLPVKVKQLEGVALYRRRELFFRFDVWPFATIYASVVLAAATCVTISLSLDGCTKGATPSPEQVRAYEGQ